MIDGAILIGGQGLQARKRFATHAAASGATLAPDFSEAGKEHVEAACALAAEAAVPFCESSLACRADLLEACARAIEGIGDGLIARAMEETGLPRARLEGERARTTGQLRMFAAVVRRGDWIDATLDSPLPQRTPLPRPDLRRRNLAVGPVVVFGASNFPLAFSVAGGDTAAAFAAGCPVVVKGHPAHAGTGELVARALAGAVADCSLPAGVFAYLPGTGEELGGALVADARVQAVAFTGSRAGGIALQKIAAARPVPIPVHAEMSSVNPVLLLPAALDSRAESLGTAFVQSLTLGAGQFCTNPGLVLALESPALQRFVATAVTALAQTPAAVMLTDSIRRNYQLGVSALESAEGVTTLARGREPAMSCEAQAALCAAPGAAFIRNPLLAHEVFGAAALLVACGSEAELHHALRILEGQLTFTLQMDAGDLPLARTLLPILERKAGRILANGWPTGVEVTHAMVHGGPFPATSDGRGTSVGSLAIARFLRPVCYQNLPEGLLPAALSASNPLHLTRRLDGILTPPTSIAP